MKKKNKLKTLNDIEVSDGDDEKFVERFDLRKEVIKWIKALHNWDIHLNDDGLPEEWLKLVCEDKLKPQDVLKFIFNIK